MDTLGNLTPADMISHKKVSQFNSQDNSAIKNNNFMSCLEVNQELKTIKNSAGSSEEKDGPILKNMQVMRSKFEKASGGVVVCQNKRNSEDTEQLT